MIDAYINNSITRKAVEKDIVDLKIYNLRNYSKGKYRQIDDTPFGGGPGMVMMAEPLFRALDDIIEKFGGTKGLKVLFPSPQGQLWKQEIAENFTQLEKLIIICCLLYTSPSPRDLSTSRMPSSA